MSTSPSSRPDERAAPWPIRDETITFSDIVLERGDHLDRVDVHYRLEGTLNAACDNVVVVVHALTGEQLEEWRRATAPVTGELVRALGGRSEWIYQTIERARAEHRASRMQAR